MRELRQPSPPDKRRLPLVPGSRLVSGDWDARLLTAAGAPVMFGTLPSRTYRTRDPTIQLVNNLIFVNGTSDDDVGIDLGLDGVTANDSDDVDQSRL
jgi:hypothetical protein